jgi:large subunit ribosomal protein L34e
VQYVTKAAKGPTCFVTRKALIGLPRARPMEYKRMKKSARTVSRAYGGVLSAGALKERVMRAFLAEEQKEAKKKMGGAD